MGRQTANVESHADQAGQPLYFVVHLQPAGFAIVSADDQTEPIIAFADDGLFDPSPDNPLGALVTNDLKGRMSAVRQGLRNRQRSPQRQTRPGPEAVEPTRKWELFFELSEATGDSLTVSGVGAVSDVRVQPLLQSRWAQDQVCGRKCYNYYTPNNYPTGCVATAMAQLMRYHRYPTAAVGQQPFLISKNGGADYWVYTLGGDGFGSAYRWADMVLTPDCATTEAQRRAIGALCFDAGVSIGTGYFSSSSQADTINAKDALIRTFQFGNAVAAYNDEQDIGDSLIAMINPNLDAKDPVIIGIRGSTGHAVVCDGYGYISSTLYHHLNMGWGGTNDAWYNLPNIDSNPAYTSIHKCVYNIHVNNQGNGEVISGRLLNEYGNAIPNVPVYARPTGQDAAISTQSDGNGIYAFRNLNSNTSYEIFPYGAGYIFTSATAATGISKDSSPVCGNVWGIDLFGTILDISSVEPTSGPPGTYLRIEGINFGDAPGVVLFPNDKQGEQVRWSDTVVFCRVPVGATSGVIQIRTATGALSTGRQFAVTSPATIFVDVTRARPDVQNGTPEAPFGTIQRGIDAAPANTMVLINPGTYAEVIRFRGRNIIVTSPAPADPQVVAATIIDGDHSGPIVTFDQAEDQMCLLSGLTLTNGSSPNGAAIYCNRASPTIANCVITGNASTDGGAGLYCADGSPLVMDCTFTGNSTAGSGGAISFLNSRPRLSGCTFTGNSAQQKAGAIFASGSAVSLYNCHFQNNYGREDGGAIVNSGSDSTMVNCTFFGNRTDGDGGAVCNEGSSNPVITNCTFSTNIAGDSGGALCNSDDSPNVTITNCILWANRDAGGSDAAAQIHGGKPVVNYSCVQGWTAAASAGSGNTGDDPKFAGAAGYQNDTSWLERAAMPTDLRLSAGSPCIDAGDNSALVTQALDLDGRPRFLDDPKTPDAGKGTRPIVDMGAYELGSLVGHWRLDETTGFTAKDSAAANNAILFGGPAWQSSGGITGGAVSLDGIDDFLHVPNEFNFDFTTAITVAAWIKTDHIDKSWQTIIAKGDSAWRLSTLDKERRVHFAVTGAPFYRSVDSANEVTLGRWHHVCGTYNGANIRLYIDGVEDPASPVSHITGMTANDHKVYIGENSEAPGRYWSGMLDDVRIYNYALTPQQVAQLICPGPAAGDLNNDCLVDIADFTVIASAWLTQKGDARWNPACDISSPADNIIDMRDMIVLINNWLGGTRRP